MRFLNFQDSKAVGNWSSGVLENVCYKICWCELCFKTLLISSNSNAMLQGLKSHFASSIKVLKMANVYSFLLD